ncbi:MAG: PD40 domain-containing protein [Bacteroidales bacterium]|nr:PD40 domain-containing protein [Bacteroidales bacterium]
MKKIVLIAFICTFFASNSISQEYYELEETFLDADSWFFYEDYKEALPLFLRVLEADSLNYNVMYKIGFCYLHIPGQKAKSIPYLEQAINRTNPNYRNNTYAEKLAPVDALFYLGNAYLINNQFDEAIDAYTGFQNAITRTKKIANKDIYDKEYLVRQFDACRNAIQLRYEPISFIASNVGNKINTRFNEFNAVVSGDGNSMVFTASLQFYDAIFYSRKVNGDWSYPMNLMGQLGIDDNSATTGLSYDGTELYIYRDDNFDGNIYVSKLTDGIWSKIRKLGPNINTKYWESHASVSPDNNQLYFVSNREDAFGDLDIYMSERTSDSTWGFPKNLGGTINTRWNENTPFVTPDGKRLFFSSEGHSGMGGYDIYYSTMQEDSTWGEPVNLGYPINTTDDDIFFVPFEKGSFAYCSQFSKKGYGGQDIYHFQLFNLPEYSNISVEGILTMDNKTERNKESFVINIIDKNKLDTIIALNPDNDEFDYQFHTPLGKNHLVYESTMAEEDGSQYFISTTYEIKELFRDEIKKQRFAQLEIEKQRLAELELEKSRPEIILDENQYSIHTDNKNVRIKMSLQKGNKLIVDTYYKDKLINSEEFDIKKEDFTYEYKPLVGESKIQFKLVDSRNNVKSEKITISYIPKDLNAELSIKDKVISLNENGDKTVKIKLKVEKNSTLFVETFVDGQLINTESFKIKKKNFEYEYVPKSDKSKLNFKLVDKYNNVKTEQVIVTHNPINEELAVVLSDIAAFDTKSFNTIIQSKEVLNAKSIEELINLIYYKASEIGISKDQAEALIIALALNIDKNTPQFIADLQKLAKGDLKTVLDSIQANQTAFKTNLDVIKELVLKAETNDYTNKDIIKLLEDYLVASNKPVSDIIKELQNLVKTDISEILNKLSSSVIDIISINDLKKHIESNNMYLEEELQRIYALMEGMLIASNAALEIDELKPPTDNDKEPINKKNNLVTLYVVIAGVLFGFFIILLYRRKNKENKKSNE